MSSSLKHELGFQWSNSTTPSAQLQSWIRLFNQPWFLRVWVLQEVTLAKDTVALYGSQRLSWHGITEMASIIYTSQSITAPWLPISQSTHMGRNVLLWHHYIESGRYPQLLELQYETRHSLCTDPRDKIYGILGLSSSDQILPLAPDYRLPVHTVYEQIAEHIIVQNRSLDILKYVEHPKMIENLPSWVPDWTFGADDNTVWRRTGQTAFGFAADTRGSSPKLTKVADFIDNARTLVVRGHSVATVAVAGTVYHTHAESRLGQGSTSDIRLPTSADTLPRLLKALGSWYQMIFDHQPHSNAGTGDGDSCYYEFLAALAAGYRWDMDES
ncbi:hypothetical protein MMC30_002360 [Trapelia coarctata]|nr:hypothetical protein [Trapelia coarctata]